ncbi:unnamed protein product, partial [Trichogramma brassicae]
MIALRDKITTMRNLELDKKYINKPRLELFFRPPAAWYEKQTKGVASLQALTAGCVESPVIVVSNSKPILSDMQKRAFQTPLCIRARLLEYTLREKEGREVKIKKIRTFIRGHSTVTIRERKKKNFSVQFSCICNSYTQPRTQRHERYTLENYRDGERERCTEAKPPVKCHLPYVQSVQDDAREKERKIETEPARVQWEFGPLDQTKHRELQYWVPGDRKKILEQIHDPDLKSSPLSEYRYMSEYTPIDLIRALGSGGKSTYIQTDLTFIYIFIRMLLLLLHVRIAASIIRQMIYIINLHVLSRGFSFHSTRVYESNHPSFCFKEKTRKRENSRYIHHLVQFGKYIIMVRVNAPCRVSTKREKKEFIRRTEQEEQQQQQQRQQHSSLGAKAFVTRGIMCGSHVQIRARECDRSSRASSSNRDLAFIDPATDCIIGPFLHMHGSKQQAASIVLHDRGTYSAKLFESIFALSRTAHRNCTAAKSFVPHDSLYIMIVITFSSEKLGQNRMRALTRMNDDESIRSILYVHMQSNLTKPFRRPLVSPIIHEKYTARVLCCILYRTAYTMDESYRAPNCKGPGRRRAVIGSRKAVTILNMRSVVCVYTGIYKRHDEEEEERYDNCRDDVYELKQANASDSRAYSPGSSSSTTALAQYSMAWLEERRAGERWTRVHRGSSNISTSTALPPLASPAPAATDIYISKH